jgi:FkbM family methyltransferase
VQLVTPPIAKALEEGWYERPEALRLTDSLEENDVVMELGAGLGFLSALAKKLVPSVRVAAFEANPELIPVIKRTHEINNVEVSVYNEMLGKEDGVAQFYVTHDFWASSAGRSFGGEPETVPVASFQRRLDEIKPTMLIVDIEGGEADIFEGVSLAGVKKIMIELHQNVIGRSGMKKVFDLLSAQDFHYDQWHSSKAIVTFSHVGR